MNKPAVHAVHIAFSVIQLVLSWDFDMDCENAMMYKVGVPFIFFLYPLCARLNFSKLYVGH